MTPIVAVRAPRARQNTSFQALVHKNDPSEAYVTGGYYRADDSISVTVDWPKTHHFYNVRSGVDSLLMAEMTRQAASFIGHKFAELDIGSVRLLDAVHVNILRPRVVLGGERDNVTLETKMTEFRSPRGELQRLSVYADFWRGGLLFGRAAVFGTSLGARVYHRLRNDAVPRVTPLLPNHSTVHRLPPCSHHDDEGRWILCAEGGDKIFYDHPTDHVPGMLIFDAIRACARDFFDAPHAEFSSCDLTFFKFLELGQNYELRLEKYERTRPANTYGVAFGAYCGDTRAAALQGAVRI